ncbi:hypothetical protein AVANS_0721 [Campylobacter sp. RM5004]|uniref:hypothetical protein n=1 Tax=Campylobacter sp. RM5004 TaxID=1660078 RepID=UPI001EFBAFAD|nr:hypothetical protein [Campylobacter sp. RM5004]ULO01351.1 hypothetical protein AVANS_0721 [Campylobacter sp. RM5004]
MKELSTTDITSMPGMEDAKQKFLNGEIDLQVGDKIISNRKDKDNTNDRSNGDK